MATELEIRVTAELREINAALTALSGRMETVGKGATKAGAGAGNLATGMRSAAREARGAADSTTALQRGIAGAVTQAKLLVGGLGILAFAKGILNASDTTKLLAGQLRLVTKTTDEFNTAQRETFAIAQRTRQGLEGTVGLYARIARTGVASQKQTLSLTETINQAVALSFSTAQSAEAAIFQLGQALGAGTLRGEELNSVLDGTPRLAAAIADGLVKLGKIKDPGDLRAYAAKNGIAAKLLVEAIATQQAKLRDEFALLPPTIAQAFVKIRNSFLKYISDASTLQEATDKIAASLETLADNFGKVAGLLIEGARAWGVYFLIFRVGPGLILGLATALFRVAVYAGLASGAMTFAAGRTQVLKNRMVEAAIKANGFSFAMTGAQIAAAKLGTKLLVLAGLVGAAFIGYKIGTYLRKEFLQVELAGIALAAGMTKAGYTIGQSFKIAGVVIKEAFLSAFNVIKRGAADMVENTGKALGALPLGAPAAALAQAAADNIRKTIKANEGVGASLKRLAAEGKAHLAEIELTYGQVAQAAIDARLAAEGKDAGAPDPAPKPAADTTLGKNTKVGIDQLALLKDAAERALVALDHLYEDAGISVAAYYAEKVRLQQESIDADIAAAQRSAAAAKPGTKERADALTQIIILERQRRDVATEAARDQLKAEDDLTDQLGKVQIKLLESEGKTARARKSELEAEYRDLLLRLGIQADAAGISLVRKLINVEAAKAGLDQLQKQFNDATSAYTQVQQTTSAQVAAGLLSNSTAEKRVEAARQQTLTTLRATRVATAELYAEFANPEARQELDRLDEQIATLSISTDDWRGKLQDAGTGALTTFFKELADGSTSAGDAVRNLAVNFTQALAAMAAQALAKKAIGAIFDLFSGGSQDGGAAQVASAAAAGLAYSTPVAGAATALGIAGGIVTTGAFAMTAAAIQLQAAATTLLIANGLGGALGGGGAAAHTGGIVGALYMSRNIHPAMFANAPRYHQGGVAGLAPNEVPVVLERGEEVLTARDKRHRNNGGLSTELGSKTPNRFIFVDDQRKAEELMRSTVGEKATLVHIGNNAAAIKELLA